MSAMPKTNIDTLSYREQALDMKVTAPSLAALSQLSQLVAKQGLTAEIQSSTPVGAGVEAHMQMRSAGARRHIDERISSPSSSAWYAGLQEREQRMVRHRRSRARLAASGGRHIAAAAIGRVDRAETRGHQARGSGLDARERAGDPGRRRTLFNDTGEAPVVIVDRVGREAGLGSALQGTQPSGNGVRVQLEAGAVRHLGDLDRHARSALRSGDRIDHRRSRRPTGSGQCQHHLRRDAALSATPAPPPRRPAHSGQRPRRCSCWRRSPSW